jgi:quercetin dioxygenase-like cupin family protein
MYFTGKWSWSFDDDGTHNYGPHAGLYSRCLLVGREVGAVHIELGLARLGPGGRVDRHVHSFEQCAYVLSGEPAVEIGAQKFRLRAGDYVLFPVGVPHGWRNPGPDEARWLEVSTPQQLAPESAWHDTCFLPSSFLPSSGPSHVDVPNFTDPTVRYLGHDPGSPRDRTGVALPGSERRREPVGMDTASLVYSGISVKMLVDANLGADLLTLFTVDYEPGGAAQVHDHPFEEAYLFVEGEIEAEINGHKATFRAGDVLFCGVGVLHGFFNTSSGWVRWLEVQAPQPPRRHSYRWPSYWDQLGARLRQEGSLGP